MRLVSLNAWGGREWDALSTWLPEIGADILCLQEVTRAPVESPDWLTYDGPPRQIENRSDLFADVSARLPGHLAFFAPGARGTMADISGAAVPSEHGIAFWVRRDLAVVELSQRFAFGSFRMDGWGPEPVPRTLQLARVAVAPGRDVLVGHVHGLRDPAGKHDTPDRARQTARILDSLAAMRAPALPVVFGGDFNVLPDSAMLADLAGQGLSDLVTGRGHNDTRTELYTKPQRYADYLLVSDEVAVRAFDVPAKPVVSDHRPLILDFDV